MNNKKVLQMFEYCVRFRTGFKRTNQEQKMCACALRRFKSGCLRLDDCYKKASDAKISAYLECESLCDEYHYEQVCSSVLGYNSHFFSWCALWIDCNPDASGEVTINLRYDTHARGKLIKVCRAPYEWIK